MTASFTHSSRKLLLDTVLRLLLLLCVPWSAFAQSSGEISKLQVERLDDDLVMSAQLQFELPAAVEEVLIKGIPVTFTAEAEIYRERWYWLDRRLTSVQRSYRVSFQPLTRRWRVTATTSAGEGGAGLSLNQSFESLSDALGHIRKISRWRIADASALEPFANYRLEFRYRLDVTQLALPMQIGTLGQSDWNVTLSASKEFSPEAVR